MSPAAPAKPSERPGLLRRPRQPVASSDEEPLLVWGPPLVGAESARLREFLALNDPTPPTLALVILGWLEPAEQLLAAGSTAQDLQVLLSVAGRHG